MDNPNGSQYCLEGDDEYDVEQANGLDDPQSPETRNVSGATNVAQLIRPTPRSNRNAQNLFMTVNTMETRR